MTKYQPSPLSLDNVTFETAVHELSSKPGFFCIDARKAKGPGGRYSIMGFEPKNTLRLTGGFVTIDGHTVIDGPFDAFVRFTKTADGVWQDAYRPFCHGLFGYIGFEAAKVFRGFEPAKGFSRFPQSSFGSYRCIVIFDHIENTAFVTSDDMDIAEGMKANLESAMPHHPKSWNWGDDDTPEKPVPSNANFKTTATSAFNWLRSEEMDRIHMVRHFEKPLGSVSAVDVFLSTPGDGEIAAMFTHEDATGILCSGELLVEISGAARADQFKELMDMLPVRRLTGSPCNKVMSFIDDNESSHRRFYGGTFGTITSEGIRFYAAEKVITVMDGNISQTIGADLTATMHPDDVVR